MSDTPSSQSPENNPAPVNPGVSHDSGTPSGSNPVAPQAVSSKSSDEKNMAVISHAIALCGLVIPFGNILGPFIFWLLKKDESPAVNRNAKEALNFQITVTLALVVCFILTFIVIGLILLPIVGLGSLILTIIAIVKASQDGDYRYPFALRLIA